MTGANQCQALVAQMTAFGANRAEVKKALIEAAIEINHLREQVRVLREALEQVTRHFTKTPSSLQDSMARGMAHKALEKTK